MAWTHAKSQHPPSSVREASPTVKALKELIHNWTQPEFVEFVERIEIEVEALRLQEGSEAWTRAEEVRICFPAQCVKTRADSFVRFLRRCSSTTCYSNRSSGLT